MSEMKHALEQQPDNKSKVIHKQLYRPGPFGGLVNTTLCGRLHKGSDFNSSSLESEVSCKFCLARIALSKAAPKGEESNHG